MDKEQAEDFLYKQLGRLEDLEKQNQELREFKDAHRYERMWILAILIVGVIVGILIGQYWFSHMSYTTWFLMNQ